MSCDGDGVGAAALAGPAVYGATAGCTDPEAGGLKGAADARKRQRINLHGIMLSLAIPCLIFAGISSMMAFKVRFEHPMLSHFVVLLCVIAVLGFGFHAFHALWEKRTAPHRHVPSWYIFVFLTSLLALVLGWFLGRFIYSKFTLGVYTLSQMHIYGADGDGAATGAGGAGGSGLGGSVCDGPGVDPTASGVKIMDAGAVYFCRGAHVDLKKAMGFQKNPSYCVAPITIGNQKLDHYDFWAVGVGCCNDLITAGGANFLPNFHCGEVGNWEARAGLRVTSNTDAANYQLAVQQASAAYGIRTEHPLFFTWVMDPINGAAGDLNHGTFGNSSVLNLGGIQGFQMGGDSKHASSGGFLGLWPFSLTDFGFGTGGGTKGGMNTQYENGVRLHTLAMYAFGCLQAVLVALAAYGFSKLG